MVDILIEEYEKNGQKSSNFLPAAVLNSYMTREQRRNIEKAYDMGLIKMIVNDRMWAQSISKPNCSFVIRLALPYSEVHSLQPGMRAMTPWEKDPFKIGYVFEILPRKIYEQISKAIETGSAPLKLPIFFAESIGNKYKIKRERKHAGNPNPTGPLERFNPYRPIPEPLRFKENEVIITEERLVRLCRDIKEYRKIQQNPDPNIIILKGTRFPQWLRYLSDHRYITARTLSKEMTNSGIPTTIVQVRHILNGSTEKVGRKVLRGLLECLKKAPKIALEHHVQTLRKKIEQKNVSHKEIAQNVKDPNFPKYTLLSFLNGNTTSLPLTLCEKSITFLDTKPDMMLVTPQEVLDLKKLCFERGYYMPLREEGKITFEGGQFRSEYLIPYLNMCIFRHDPNNYKPFSIDISTVSKYVLQGHKTFVEKPKWQWMWRMIERSEYFVKMTSQCLYTLLSSAAKKGASYQKIGTFLEQNYPEEMEESGLLKGSITALFSTLEIEWIDKVQLKLIEKALNRMPTIVNYTIEMSKSFSENLGNIPDKTFLEKVNALTGSNDEKVLEKVDLLGKLPITFTLSNYKSFKKLAKNKRIPLAFILAASIVLEREPHEVFGVRKEDMIPTSDISLEDLKKTSKKRFQLAQSSLRDWEPEPSVH